MANVKGVSSIQKVPGVYGENTGGGDGIRGVSHGSQSGVAGANDNASIVSEAAGPGVSGSAKGGVGVIGTSDTGIGMWGHSNSNTGTGGVSETGIGVHGISTKGPAGVRGDCASGVGVSANSVTGRAVEGNSPQGTGVVGTSTSGVGVWGGSDSSSGVGGMSNSGHGVHGVSKLEHGVVGNCTDGTGVGVWGSSVNGEGVHAETQSQFVAAIAGFNRNPNGTGAAIYGEHSGAGPAGFFKGDVVVTGDVKLTNADCAEDFDIADAELVEPGTVMVLGDDGILLPSHSPYDKRVAGVVSGAGDYKPGIVLDKQEGQLNRKPIALMGKVYCKVDAQYGIVEIGDLLTTSATSGHAMKAKSQERAFGAVIGKALRPLRNGRGLIPILIALQ